MSPPKRVIFDRSAFSNPGFEQLKLSQLNNLCQQGRVIVFHTPVFLNETLAAYGAGKSASDWTRHLEFAIEIGNGGMFLSKEEIWREELVVGLGTHANYLETEASQQHLIGVLREVCSTGDIGPEWSDTEPSRLDQYNKKANQRAELVDLRSEVSAELKRQKKKWNRNTYTYQEAKKSLYLSTGETFMKNVCRRRKKMLAKKWVNAPEQYPFYSAFVEGFLYSQYHAIAKPNEPIDKNAQSDYEQLAYLTWADIVVSNDQKFFRSAFETIWNPCGKRLYTSAGFAEYINQYS